MKYIYGLMWIAAVWLLSAFENGAATWTIVLSIALTFVLLIIFLAAETITGKKRAE